MAGRRPDVGLMTLKNPFGLAKKKISDVKEVSRSSMESTKLAPSQKRHSIMQAPSLKPPKGKK